jgi:amino acid permease
MAAARRPTRIAALSHLRSGDASPKEHQMSLDTSAAVPAAPPARRLKRSMGLWMATALVVGNMIGSGVFLLPASLAGTAGPISIFGWIFTGAGAMLLALVFANLGPATPRSPWPSSVSSDAAARLGLACRCACPGYGLIATLTTPSRWLPKSS